MIFQGLFAISVIICLPGIYFMFQTEKRMPDEYDISNKERLIAHLITVGLFGVIGAFVVPKVSILTTGFNLNLILKYGLIFGLICSVGNIVMYYFYLVKTISNKDYVAIEKHYHDMGILSRIFYGGFVEEIIFRWGIMSLVLWILQFMIKPLNITAVIIAIGISSMLFALAHLPSIKMVSAKPTRSMYIYTMIGNVWVGLFTGWAFLEAGIFSAIIVHILFHIVWYPIQKMRARHN